jgi:hypothetical protein
VIADIKSAAPSITEPTDRPTPSWMADALRSPAQNSPPGRMPHWPTCVVAH